MSSTPSKTRAHVDYRTLLDPEQLKRVFGPLLDFDPPPPRAPHDFRVVRCWPAKKGAFRFEWSFRAGLGRRFAFYGVPAKKRSAPRPSESGSPRLTDEHLVGLHTYLPEYGLLIHSPDRDPRMPHLNQCTDARAIGEQLAATGVGPPASVPACTLLGYKAGRRAAIRYSFNGAPAKRANVVGKTFRDARGRRMIARHREVGRQMRELSDGHATVPEALGYLPELRLALFGWAAGRGPAKRTPVSLDDALRAIDVVAALHRVEIDDLGEFTIEQECAIARRWIDALERLRPDLVERGRELLAALLRMSTTLERGPLRTIHRDFYEMQLVWNGRGATLLDLDTLAKGDPAQDLGNFIAHLALNGLQTSARSADLPALAEPLLLRYESSFGPVDRRAVGFYCASSLIRNGALHSLRTETSRYSSDLWDAAAGLLDGRAAFSGS